METTRGSDSALLLDAPIENTSTSTFGSILRLHRPWKWKLKDPFGTIVAVQLRFLVCWFCLSTWILWVFCGLLLFHVCDTDLSTNGPQSFSQALYFAIQSVTTIGYGHLYPVEDSCNIGVGFIAMLGALFDTVWIGVLFTRVSRAGRYPGVCWSDNLLVNSSHVLTFRMVNLRTKPLVDASVRVFASIWCKNCQGEDDVTFHQLKLVNGSGEAEGYYERPLFNLPWSFSHDMDDPSSPLYNLRTAHAWDSGGVEIIAVLEGIDPLTSNSLQICHTYSKPIWNACFQPAIRRSHSKGVLVDLSEFNTITTLEGRRSLTRSPDCITNIVLNEIQSKV